MDVPRSQRTTNANPALGQTDQRVGLAAFRKQQPAVSMFHYARFLSLLFLVTATAHAQEWTRFRGPNGTGISDTKGIPAQWTSTDYRWKATLPGTGLSSPVAWGNRVFVTAADTTTGRRSVTCLALDTGKLLWSRDESFSAYKKHRQNSFASGTPAVDARRVYAIWQSRAGSSLVSYTHDGTPAWKVPLGSFKGGHGPATSPIVHDGTVYVCNDHEGPSFLLAVNAADGQVKWKVPRSGKRACYCTPCVFRRPGHGTEIIFVHSYQGIWGVDSVSGKKHWAIDVFGTFKQRAIASPLVAGDLIIGSSGFTTAKKNIVAVRPGKKINEVSEAFRVSDSVPHIPTPLVYQDHMYLWADIGIVSCIALKTGQPVWRKRVGGKFFGSPICVDGRLFAIDSKGQVIVLAASPSYKLLARNPLGEASHATPSVSGGRLLLRTDGHLVAVGGE
ncbi:MAG: PQQ-binding-like beta-propeller repeat protein [Planctomycetaceae bacterium]|nr:PQQ-binding-like beta-propeller repeat protein [Planctomycetaceae bacterium]